MIHSQRLFLALLVISIAPNLACADTSLIREGEQIEVAPPIIDGANQAAPSTRNDSALAIQDDGAFAVGIHYELYENSLRTDTSFELRIYDAQGNLTLFPFDTLIGSIQESPSVLARSDGLFIANQPVFSNASFSRDLISQQYAPTGEDGAYVTTGPAVRIPLSDAGCANSSITFNQAPDTASYTSSLQYLQVCATDARLISNFTRFGQSPAGESEIVQSDVVDLVDTPPSDGQPPAPGRLDPSTTIGPDGRIFASYTADLDPAQTFQLRPVLLELNQDQEIINTSIFDVEIPFVISSGLCGHPDQPHLWMSTIREGNEDDDIAVLLKIVEGELVDTIDLGVASGHGESAVKITGLACDPWGNASVVWVGMDDQGTPDITDDVDAVQIAVVNSDGEIIQTIAEPQPINDFIVRTRIAMSPSGKIVASWTSFFRGIFAQRYQLSGHIPVDGTSSGSFFSPFFNGEGYVFDIVDINGQPTIVVYYFTYLPDASGKQAWLVGSAPIVDNLATVEVGIGEGGVFGEDFDPADVTIIPSGTVTVRFISCGLVKVTTESETFGSQEYIAQNLTGVPLGVDGLCSDALAPALKSDNKTVDATQGGSVFTPVRNGEGFIFDVVNVGGVDTLVVYYFTYQPDGSGEMAWIVGSGPIDQGTDTAVATVAIAEGGVFGSDFDPSNITFTEWGTITVTWISCDEILIEYDGLWGMGSFTVQPLTPALIGATGNCQ